MVVKIKPKVVYIVRSNADMTEGRGPMLLDSVWDNLEAAKTYMDQQEGVFGRKGPFSDNKSGDWTWEEIPVNTSADVKKHLDAKKARAKALKKLTPYERELLGIEDEDE